jgi:predicted RNA-binding Zn-ribbon protein involved in translation (DUF1610 family)
MKLRDIFFPPSSSARGAEEESPPFPFLCPQCGERITLLPPEQSEEPSWTWLCRPCGSWGGTRPGAVVPVVWVEAVTFQ